MDILVFALFILFLAIYVAYRLIKVMKSLTWFLVVQGIMAIILYNYIGWAAEGGRARKTELYISMALFIVFTMVCIAFSLYAIMKSHEAGIKAKVDKLPGETVDQAADRIFKEDLYGKLGITRKTTKDKRQ